MKYTVRFCHMEDLPGHVAGDLLAPGELIGKMGSTGKSTAPHLHFDVVEGFHTVPWRLYDMERRLRDPSPRQQARFISYKLFNTEPEITTYYCDPRYRDKSGNLIIHTAYDIVPKDRHDTKNHWWIHWPIDETGLVLSVGHDRGYGNYIHGGYEV